MAGFYEPVRLCLRSGSAFSDGRARGTDASMAASSQKRPRPEEVVDPADEFSQATAEGTNAAPNEFNAQVTLAPLLAPVLAAVGRGGNDGMLECR
jgi:hypothetical protein